MSAEFGFFGKFPALGDFVRGGNIPRCFVNAWDPFLQKGFLASRAALADKWAEVYQTAPIWRFAIGADIIDGGPYTGVMMPSQDAVGRLFPLTIVAPCAMPENGLNNREFYLPIEDAALDMLDSLRGKIDLEILVSQFELPDALRGIAADTSQWLSAPEEGFGAPLGLSHIGLPNADSFKTLLSQDVSCWQGSVIKGGEV